MIASGYGFSVKNRLPREAPEMLSEDVSTHVLLGSLFKHLAIVMQIQSLSTR